MDDDLIAVADNKLSNYCLTHIQNQIMSWIILNTKFCQFHNSHILIRRGLAQIRFIKNGA